MAGVHIDASAAYKKGRIIALHQVNPAGDVNQFSSFSMLGSLQKEI